MALTIPVARVPIASRTDSAVVVGVRSPSSLTPTAVVAIRKASPIARRRSRSDFTEATAAISSSQARWPPTVKSETGQLILYSAVHFGGTAARPCAHSRVSQIRARKTWARGAVASATRPSIWSIAAMMSLSDPTSAKAW